MGGAVCSPSTLLISSYFALFLLLLLVSHQVTGGPGYSDLYALAFEIGPFAFKKEEYNGSVPLLVLSPHSWTKVSSIIFVDLPVNTGFSYTKLPATTERSDYKRVQHALQFMRKWLIHHPEFLSNTFYVGGDSYSELTVPPLALEILNGNEDNVQPSINYQGYLLGNPLTDFDEDQNARIPFAHRMWLISDELYESLKSSCGGEYQNVDPSNEKCAGNIAAFQKLVSGLDSGHILGRSCPIFSLNPQQYPNARSLSELFEYSFVSKPSLPTVECQNYENVLAHYWANDNMVQKALASVSGDHDITVPFCGTEAWIKSLNYSVVDEWRQWLVQGQVAGVEATLLPSTNLKSALQCSRDGFLKSHCNPKSQNFSND